MQSILPLATTIDKAPTTPDARSSGVKRPGEMTASERRKYVQDRREYLVQQGLKQNNPLVSIKVLLSDLGLIKYYPLFRDAGYDVIHNYNRREDEEVEAVIDIVERQNKILFPRCHRVAIFKALRFRWFRNPQFIKRFMTRRELPKLALPKKDFKTRDAEVDYKYLDPARQRMVMRRSHTDETSGTQVVQYEVYYREPDIFYQVLDLQRTLVEWQMSDPRKMVREDPREEVYFMRLKKLEIRLGKIIDHIKATDTARYAYYVFLNVVRLVMLFLALLNIFIVIDNARKHDSRMFMTNFASAAQLKATIPYLLAAIISFEVARRDTNSQLWLARYARMHQACKIMQADLVTFRLDSDGRRFDKVGNVKDLELTKERKRKVEVIEQVHKKDLTNFDGWMTHHLSLGLPDKFDIRADLHDSLQILPQSSHELLTNATGFVNRTKPPPSVTMQIDPPAVDPSRALTISSAFFDEEKHKMKMELVDRRLQWQAQQQLKDEESEYDDDEGEYDDDEDEEDSPPVQKGNSQDEV